MKSNKILFIVLFFIVQWGFSQTGTLRGFIYEKGSREPIVFGNIILKGTNYGAASDMNGFFTISNIKPGTYTASIQYIGYKTKELSVTIVKNQITTKKIYLEKTAVALEEVKISVERQEMRTQVHASIVKISSKQIKQIPSVGGEPDLAQYLQVIPGVVFTGDQGGQLYIRGGTPIQNKVLLDGMTVYNPFHSIGLFSVFDADIIRNVDVYTGGFSAKYGDRISSIMDIRMREGNFSKYKGKISASPFGAKLMFEGPIVRSKEPGGGGSSFIFSTKTSYLEQTSKLLYSYIDTGGLPFNYTDFYGKITLDAANGSKVNIYGFNFGDNVHYQALSDLNWRERGIGSNIIMVPSQSNALIKINVNYSDYGISLQSADNLPRSSTISGFNMGMENTYFIGKDQVDAGLDLQAFKTNFTFYNSVGRKLEQMENTTELGAYVRYKKTFNKLLFDPSIRLQYYASLSETSIEPRLGMKYLMSKKVRVKFAGGYYTQNLISASSDRDVMNLFYGFLSGPENLPKEFNGKPVTSKLQKAWHAISGVEYDINSKFELNVEGYYKYFPQLTNINRNKIFDDNGDNSDQPDFLKKDYIIEQGDAYGVDFLLKYNFKKWYIWAVYSLGYSHRFDGYQTYPPHFDRRHNINLLATYTFGADLNWQVSARWNFGSGFPFTPTQGEYEQLSFSSISENYVSANGDIGFVYADLNSGRQPTYHRLDITLKHWIEFLNESRLEFNLSVTNIYNRQNIFYFDRLTHQQVNQLPFMPSLGLNYKF